MSTHADDASATDLKHLRVIAKTEGKPCLEEVLAGTIELQKADLGCVHLCNPDTKWPEMVADRGHSRDFIGHFLQDGHDERAIWSRALVRRKRIIVEDIWTDASFACYRTAADGGYRAVQSTPLFSRDGVPLGAISTFFREPHVWTDQELRFSDLYAALAVELVERQRAEEALQASEARYRMLIHTLPVAIYTCDETGHITLFNDAAIKLWGARPTLKETNGADRTSCTIPTVDRCLWTCARWRLP